MVNFGDYIDGHKIENKNDFILNRNGSKRKFDTYSRAIVTFPNYTIKIVAYLSSWFLKVVALILTKIARKKQSINKVVFYFIYYQHKIHFGIFNTFIGQGILLTTRTILHTKTFPPSPAIFIDKIISIICFTLVVVDFFFLFKTIIDYKDIKVPE